jgi:hypothetical protein
VRTERQQALIVQSAEIRRRALVLVATMLLASPIAIAAKSKRPRFIQETPKFDTTYMPRTKPFALEIKRTRILYAEEPGKMLHARAQVVKLQAEQTAHVLQGRVEEAHDPTSPLNTLEHGTRFHLDLQKLVARVAPEIAWQLDTQIANARRKQAGEVAREEKNLDRQLHARRPTADIPAVPPSVDGSARDSELKAQLAQSQAAKRAAHLETGKLAMAISTGNGSASMPAILPSRVDLPPLLPGSGNVGSAEDALNGALNAAKKQTPIDPLDGQLAAAKKQSQRTVQLSQPVMDMVLTSVRPVSPTSFPPASDGGASGDSVDVIEWDKWHANFASLARQPILTALDKAHNPSGANTIEITVQRDHKLTAKIVKPSSPDFDQAMLQAYASLDANKRLSFPTGSQRMSVTFLIDNEHTGKGAPTGVNSKTSAGDKEFLLHHI